MLGMSDESVSTPTAPAPSAEVPVAQEIKQPATYETLSEDDQIIFDLKAEHAAKVNGDSDESVEEPVKEVKDKKSTKDKTPPKDTQSTVKYNTAEEAVSSIVAALESGDPKKIAKAIGKPEKFLEVTDAKWMAFREQQNAIRERDKQVTQREHAYNENVAAIRKEYGAAVQAAKAYREGKLDQFVTLVQELTGETYDEAQRKVIKGELSLDPNTRELRKEIENLRAERAREKKEAEEARNKQAQQEQYRKAEEAVTAELASHRVSKVKGFQRDVLSRVRDSWDGQDYTMSFEEAADLIMAEKDAEAEALGYSRANAVPAKPTKQPASPSVPPRSRAVDAREPDGEPWMTQDMDDDEIIASIARDHKMGRLK